MRKITSLERVLICVCLLLALLLGTSYILLSWQPSERDLQATVAVAVRATSAVPAFILDTDRSQPLTHGLQQPVEAGTTALTVLRVDKWDRLGAAYSVKPGHIYVVVEVLVATVGPGATSYSILEFRLLDDAGHIYPAIAAPEPGLRSGSLLVNEEARGFVSFQVPEKASGFLLSYERWAQPCRVSRRFDLGM